MEIILSIIFIVFGILQIILFFKLWKMTNDVSELLSEYKANRNRELGLPRKAKVKDSGKEISAICVENGMIVCNEEEGGVLYRVEYPFDEIELI